MLSKTAELDDLLNELLQESDGMDDPSLTSQMRRLSSDDGGAGGNRVPWWRQRQATAPVDDGVGVEHAGFETKGEEADGGEVEMPTGELTDGPRPPPRGTSVAVMDG